MIKNEINKLRLQKKQFYTIVFQKTEKNAVIWSSLKTSLRKKEPGFSLMSIKNNVMKSVCTKEVAIESSTYVLYVNNYETVRFLYDTFFADPKKTNFIFLELILGNTSLNSLQLAEQNEYYSSPLIGLNFFCNLK